MLSLESISAAKVKTDVLIIPVSENFDIHYSETALLVKQALEMKEFSGKKGEEIIFYDSDKVLAKRVIFSGIGKLEEIDYDIFRKFSGKIVKKCIKNGFKQIAIVVPSPNNLKMELRSLVGAFGEGACLGNHLFDKYKKEKEYQPLKRVSILVNSDAKKKLKGLTAEIETICYGTVLAREWVSTPSNDKKPEQFANLITTLAKDEDIKVNVFSEEDLKQGEMGAILAVASGSKNKPLMLILDYAPKSAKKTHVLVGKGITFDSGGINLKPTSALDEMKMDMAGAATAAAVVITSAKLKINSRIIGIMPLVENMPSGSAMRPGDIVKSFKGKTIEIINTDAEGRLILADALSYAEKTYKPDTIIDIATLTGACAVALGEKIAGVFSFDENLSKAIVNSGIKVHERCWQMPMPKDYKRLLKSEIADIRNTSSSRWGGAITAALFLSEFISSNTRWVHIDIAGTAFLKKPDDYCGAGGTGFGVRLLVDLILNSDNLN